MTRPWITWPAAALLLGLAACSSGNVADIKPGEQPSAESDEGGLWMMLDRAEKRVRSSGRVVEAPDLQDYLEDLLCRLDAAFCSDVRLYVVRVPHFNATMAPNGAMHIWTGTLLRMENEAQLAHVLGHELVHFKKRHSLKQWQNSRAKLDAVAIAQALGGGVAGSLAVLAVAPGIYSFSREQEREADLMGVEMVTAAGYAPQEAVNIWRRVKEESGAEGDEGGSLFFATHPAVEERIEALQRFADSAPPPDGGWHIGQDTYLAAIKSHRSGWLRSELKQRRFDRTLVLLDRLTAARPQDGELTFFQGEVYRMRGDVLDGRKAAAAYEQAIAMVGAPVEVYRSMGLVYWDLGEIEKAKAAFEAYIERAPNAEDRAIIDHYLQQIGQTLS